MNDPSDMSVGSPEDRAHRELLDKPEDSLDLIDEMGGEFLRHEDFHQGIRAAAAVLLDRWRAHDPCDIVLDGDGSIDAGGGPVCARHGCRKGTCPIDTFEAKHGLQ